LSALYNYLLNYSGARCNVEVGRVHQAFVAVVEGHVKPARLSDFLGKLLGDHARVDLAVPAPHGVDLVVD
jgi:hypothetical protein